MNIDDDLPDDLSDNPTIDSIVMLVGRGLLEKMSAELGGRRIYIPHHPGADSPMAVCIGLDAAEKISQVYGGMHFEVPIRAGVRTKILKCLDEGMPKARIAPTVGCSRRMVYKVLEEEAARQQMSLFS